MLLDARFWQLERKSVAAGVAGGDSVPSKQRGAQLEYILSALLSILSYRHFEARTARRVGAIGEAAPELPF